MSAILNLLAVALLQTPTAPPQSSLSQKHDVLQAQVAITTLPAAEVTKTPATMPIEHDTEVSRTETITAVVDIQKCEPGRSGKCEATADLMLKRPDGSTHSEMKNISLATLRGTATLALKPDDATGIYTLIATVRDPNARRVAKPERLFGVK